MRLHRLPGTDAAQILLEARADRAIEGQRVLRVRLAEDAQTVLREREVDVRRIARAVPSRPEAALQVQARPLRGLRAARRLRRESRSR
jgi:hypothetical protein